MLTEWLELVQPPWARRWNSGSEGASSEGAGSEGAGSRQKSLGS